MSEIDKVILVALDGTTVAEGSLPYAEAIAAALGAGIRLVWVEASHGAHERGSSRSKHPSRADEYLGAVGSRLTHRGHRVSTQVDAAGQVSEGIVRAAEQPEVAIVAIATHGRCGIERWLEGSVAERVVDACEKPVLLVVPSDLPGGQPPVTLNRIVVPLDGSRLAEAAIPLAADIASGAGATLVFVRVLSPMSAPGALVPNEEAWESERTEAANAYLANVRSCLPRSLRSDALVVLGLDAANGIVRFAETEGIDLTVMSGHEYRGLQRAVMGSVADQVVRAGLPTILVGRSRDARPEGEAQTTA